jgi:hypothetical protein
VHEIAPTVRKQQPTPHEPQLGGGKSLPPVSARTQRCRCGTLATEAINARPARAFRRSALGFSTLTTPPSTQENRLSRRCPSAARGFPVRKSLTSY